MLLKLNNYYIFMTHMNAYTNIIYKYCRIYTTSIEFFNVKISLKKLS